MKLYCQANSKSNIGYVPEWLRVYFFTEEAMKLPEEEREYSYVTFDLQGSIDYDASSLNCRVKGDMIPWVKCIDGDEVDLSSMTNEELETEYPNSKIIDMIRNAKQLQEDTDAYFITLGIYPIQDDDDAVWDAAEEDVLSDGQAELCLNGCASIKFAFDTQLNNE
jgi:hypothetical protein